MARDDEQDDAAARMRRDWDRRARENARLYIADKDAEGLDFAYSGCRDAAVVLNDLRPFLREDMRVLEIGCGIGRMLQFLAVMFAEVHGIDVSPEMIVRGREYLARFPNVHLEAGDGCSLAPYPDRHFDLIVSVAVFLHSPEKSVVRSNVAEAQRTLRPGGLFKFMVKVARWAGQGPVHDTWNGVEISEADVDEWAAAIGFERVNAYIGDDPSTAWVILRKPA